MAIIAVLVSVSVPVFASQFEKSREATDAAKIRAAFVKVMSDAILDPDNDPTNSVSLVQTQKGRQSSCITNIGGTDVSGLSVGKDKTAEVKYDHITGQCTIGIQGSEMEYHYEIIVITPIEINENLD